MFYSNTLSDTLEYQCREVLLHLFEHVNVLYVTTKASPMQANDSNGEKNTIPQGQSPIPLSPLV